MLSHSFPAPHSALAWHSGGLISAGSKIETYDWLSYADETAHPSVRLLLSTIDKYHVPPTTYKSLLSLILTCTTSNQVYLKSKYKGDHAAGTEPRSITHYAGRGLLEVRRADRGDLKREY